MRAGGQGAGACQRRGRRQPCERCQEQRLVEPPATPEKRWVCKGSATAELLLTVRGSSCREREPGSANTNTQIAENKMCGRASWLSISSTQGAHCGRSGCNGGGLVLSLKCLRGGRGQPHEGLARRGRLCQVAGMVSVLLAGQRNPPSSLAAAQLLSSHAHSSRRDEGGTSNICCCFGEVLVWRVIPAIKNYSQSTQKAR